MEAHSPISLTDKGRNLATEMGLYSMIADNWDKIYSYLGSNIETKNAYDIQQFCIENASVNLDKFFDEKSVEN